MHLTVCFQNQQESSTQIVQLRSQTASALLLDAAWKLRDQFETRSANLLIEKQFAQLKKMMKEKLKDLMQSIELAVVFDLAEETTLNLMKRKHIKDDSKHKQTWH